MSLVERTDAVLEYPEHLLEPQDLVNFVELPGFLEEWLSLGLTRHDLLMLQASIMADPAGAWALCGDEGTREFQFVPSGDRPSVAVWYDYLEEHFTVLLITVYRGDRAFLTSAGRAKLRSLREEYLEAIQ